MEAELLKTIATAAEALATMDPVDGRKKLRRNKGAKKWKKRDVAALKGMVWHQELGWGSVEAVARYHTGPKSHLRKGGVHSIAYTCAIRRNGQVVLCNDLDQAVWSQGFKGRPGDENAEFMSVMFEGFFKGPGITDSTAGEPNQEQLLAGLSLWKVARDHWGWGASDLYGHYHFGKPSCPGTTLEGVIESIRADAPTALDLSGAKGRQLALKQLGYAIGKVDGVWGPKSRAALIEFQSDQKLVADGVWGPKTAAAVVSALAKAGKEKRTKRR